MDREFLEKLFQDKDYVTFRKEISTYPLADIGEFLNNTEIKDILLAFRLLPKEIGADVFAYLSPEIQSEITMLINETELRRILDDLYFDDKMDMLEEMPANVVKRILKNTSEVERKLINQFLNYPDDSAGSLMTIEFVDLKKDMTVKEALKHIRSTAPDKETIYTCYITNERRQLEGTASLKDLVIADPAMKVEDIMRKDPIFVHTNDDQEMIANIVRKYDLLAIPVVDNEDRLVGIITIDDIVDVIEEETTEDFHKMAAVIPQTEEYLDSGAFFLARKRFAWLLVLMISATFTGFIIKGFAYTLETHVILAAFIPMLMNTGGNAGAQSSAIIIRSIVLNEVGFKDIFKVIFKEFRVSLIVGIVLSILNFLRILIMDRDFYVAMTVGLTMIFTITIAKMLGGFLPLLAKKINIDPTVMASPIITTIVDSIALIIYFLIANWLLGV